MLTHLLVATYLIEAGVLLIVAPWTAWWRQNFFAAAFPVLHTLMATWFVRGFVIAVGAVTMLAGFTDLRAALGKRWSSEERSS